MWEVGDRIEGFHNSLLPEGPRVPPEPACTNAADEGDDTERWQLELGGNTESRGTKEEQNTE